MWESVIIDRRFERKAVLSVRLVVNLFWNFYFHRRDSYSGYLVSQRFHSLRWVVFIFCPDWASFFVSSGVEYSILDLRVNIFSPFSSVTASACRFLLFQSYRFVLCFGTNVQTIDVAWHFSTLSSSNRPPTSFGILIVCLQKDAKQCCGVRIDFTHWSNQHTFLYHNIIFAFFWCQTLKFYEM